MYPYPVHNGNISVWFKPQSLTWQIMERSSTSSQGEASSEKEYTRGECRIGYLIDVDNQIDEDSYSSPDKLFEEVV